MAFGGLSDHLEYFEMQLDSYDTKISPSAGESPKNWPLFYLTRPLTNVAAVKILEAEIPFSFYVFNDRNNTFTFSVASQGVTNALVTIPVGNYTAYGLAELLQILMNQAAILQNGSFPSTAITVTYSGDADTPSTGKLTFNLIIGATNIGVPWSMTFNDPEETGNLTPRYFLGFNAGTINSVFVTGTGNAIEAPNVALITGANYLYVNSRRLGQLCNMFLPLGAANLGGGISGPQLAKIPVNVQPNGTIFWQDADPSKWFDLENLVNFTDVDFYLTLGNSSSQVPLNLNGLSFSLKLGILVNRIVSNNLLGGHVSHNRVFRKIAMK